MGRETLEPRISGREISGQQISGRDPGNPTGNLMGGLSGGRARWLALAAILILAAGLRLWGLGTAPLWLDETSSLWFSSQSWRFLWAEVPRIETHPPFYYMILKAWTGYAGTAEAALRAPSALFSLGVVICVFLAGRMVGRAQAGWAQAGWALGLTAAALAALWKLQLVYAQDARPYALGAMGVALMMAGALRLFAGPAHPKAPPSGYPSGHPSGRLTGQIAPIWALGAIALGMSLALWSHLLGAVPAGLTGLTLIVWWLGPGRRARALLLRLAGTGLAVAVLCAPHALNVLGQLGRDFSSFWIVAPDLEALARITHQAIGQPTLRIDLRVEVAVSAALAGLGLIGLLRFLRGAAGHAWAPVLWIAGYLSLLIAGHWLAVAALTYLVQPIFLPRTLIFLQPPLFLVLAGLPWILGSAGGRWQRLRAGVTRALTVALCLYAAIGAFRLGGVLEFPRPWPQIVAEIAASDRAAAPVAVIPPLAVLPLRYYAGRAGADLDLRPLPGPFETAAQGQPDFIGQPVTAADVEAILALTAGGTETVWLVARRPWANDPQETLAAMLTVAGFVPRLVLDSDGTGGWITLTRFDRPGG